ncbi:MAG: hypothetical protein ACYCX5_12500 [Coriobacteriia bacterium]
MKRAVLVLTLRLISDASNFLKDHFEVKMRNCLDNCFSCKNPYCVRAENESRTLDIIGNVSKRSSRGGNRRKKEMESEGQSFNGRGRAK